MRIRLQTLLNQYPVTSSITILGVNVVLSLLLTAIMNAVIPGSQSEFVTLCVLTLVTFAFVAVLGWWNIAGFNGVSNWRHLSLLVLPAIIIVIPPVVGGIKPAESGSPLYLIVAYLLVGLREEVLWRGVVLQVLKPLGARRAVIVAGVLFGLSHLANLAVRSNPFVVLAQVVGSICDGIGFGALRIRTNTIWFLIILHGLHDLLLQYTRLPAIPLDVVQVTLLLIYGLYLLRTQKTSTTQKAFA